MRDKLKASIWLARSKRYTVRGNPGIRNIIARKELEAAAQLWNRHYANTPGYTLDLGAGNGIFWNYAKCSTQLIFCDLVSNFRTNVDNATRIAGDACLLPFEGQIFSSIVALGLTEYLSDLRLNLSQWKRLCMTDACLLLSSSPPTIPNLMRKILGMGIYTRNDCEMEKIINDSGWKIVAGPVHAGWQSLFYMRSEN